ncbi:ferrous iron transport protein B [Marispirochaeta aestuarii]|uniref:ferrous iron transport protein B n=1 Tax=Marispirochaeta aestuarii TaxID=1963862 RepID=UPI0029C9A061|nr:ferrous iron transport protein B [Marispirochaeta aestuarii]
MSTDILTRTFTIALAGQPNTGKSTVFNRLTGSRQHVGNWPGKTVEKKAGSLNYRESSYTVVDLPGTYSLTANSLEETIARDFLIHEQPDVVVVLADASQLERTLYLLGEIRLLAVQTVLALNMLDVAEKQGKNIDPKALEKELGIPVIPMTAARGIGMESLLESIAACAAKKEPRPQVYMEESGCLDLYRQIHSLIKDRISRPYTPEWAAVKLIEGDPEAMREVEARVKTEDMEHINNLINSLVDGPLQIAGARYSWIQKAVSAALGSEEILAGTRKRSGFDRAAIHPVWGKVIALGIMTLAFAGALMLAMPIMAGVQKIVPAILSGISAILAPAPPWITSMIADGIIPGLSIGVMMLAYIFGVYLVFGILEDVGYLARLAYLFDSWMHRIGLHGKSFMPLLMSFGCNIAGVTGSRTVDSWQQRMTTLVMVSIVPCMALWGVVGFMGAIFFGSAMPILVLSLLGAMLLQLALTSALLRNIVVKGEQTGLIMELPPYHRPNWKTIWSYVWGQVKGFSKRAITLIALISLAVWALSYQPDGNMENSLLAAIGKFFDPVSGLMGMDWKLFIALVAAVAAKEASLSVLAVLYGAGEGIVSITGLLLAGGGAGHAAIAGSIAGAISPASALAFIFAFFFSIPCIGTVATIYSETKSLKWTAGCSLYYTLTSFIAGVLAYHVGLLIF